MHLSVCTLKKLLFRVVLARTQIYYTYTVFEYKFDSFPDKHTVYTLLYVHRT